MKNYTKVKKAIDEISKKFKNIATEDYLTKVLCLNGTMTVELFDKVMTEVIDREILDDESIGYHEEEYLITRQEFFDVFHYIEKVISLKLDVKAMLEIHEGFFNYKGNSFNWSLTMGQGSSYTIRAIDIHYSEYPEIKIDPEIKFYKRLKDDNI